MSEPNESRKLFIKHAVGSRMLLDVSGTQKPFVLEKSERGWRFVIGDVDSDAAALLSRYAADLNLFYFVQPPGLPVQKAWFYDKDIPVIVYDNVTSHLTIDLDAMMEYNNEKV